MLDIFSNVPQSLKKPAVNEMRQSKGMERTIVPAKLQKADTMAAVIMSCLDVNRNLRRKRIGNGMHAPTTPQRVIIVTSSRIRHV